MTFPEVKLPKLAIVSFVDAVVARVDAMRASEICKTLCVILYCAFVYYICLDDV